MSKKPPGILKGRTKYWLTEEEGAVVDDMRAERKQQKRKEKPRCSECVACRHLPYHSYVYPARKDGLCGTHWNQRFKSRCGVDGCQNFQSSCKQHNPLTPQCGGESPVYGRCHNRVPLGKTVCNKHDAGCVEMRTIYPGEKLASRFVGRKYPFKRIHREGLSISEWLEKNSKASEHAA